jgi:DNA-binding response OmpR family regulator
MRILLVEDNKKAASFVRKALQTEGWEVATLHDGTRALSTIQSETFEVIILDIMLPGPDGLTILKSIRAAGIATPVLLLTARGQVHERVQGLDAGADDYLSKPFAMPELVARVRALNRRMAELPVPMLKFADLSLDTIKRIARRGNRVIELATREFRVLEFLMRSPGRVCGRMTIVQEVWDYDFDPGTNLVDVYIMRLREKIDSGFDSKLLHTVRGVGYVLRESE